MTDRRPITLALVVALAATTLLAAGTSAAERNVVVIGDTLRPAQLEIDPDTTVTWHNRDDERHRMRSKDGPVRFDSKNLEPGESFSFTFTVEGSYPYYDHRDRDDAAYFGMIVVGGVALHPDAPLPDTGSVSIIDKSFRPGTIAIATGGTVEWANDDGEAHTVTATDGGFDSGILNGGGTFSQTFTEAGSYPYFCAIHPEMTGTVTVTESDGDSDDPATDSGHLAATGMVVDVQGTLTQADRFDLRLSDGQILTFVPPPGVLEESGFSTSHLRENMTLSHPITVTYIDEDGVNVVTGVGDANE